MKPILWHTLNSSAASEEKLTSSAWGSSGTPDFTEDMFHGKGVHARTSTGYMYFNPSTLGSVGVEKGSVSFFFKTTFDVATGLSGTAYWGMPIYNPTRSLFTIYAYVQRTYGIDFRIYIGNGFEIDYGISFNREASSLARETTSASTDNDPIPNEIYFVQFMWNKDGLPNGITGDGFINGKHMKNPYLSGGSIGAWGSTTWGNVNIHLGNSTFQSYDKYIDHFMIWDDVAPIPPGVYEQLQPFQGFSQIY